MIYGLHIDFIRAYHERYFVHRPFFCPDSFAEANGRRGGKRAGRTNSNVQVGYSACKARRACAGGFRCAHDLAGLLAVVHFVDHHDFSYHVRFRILSGAGIQADVEKV